MVHPPFSFSIDTAQAPDGNHLEEQILHNKHISNIIKKDDAYRNLLIDEKGDIADLFDENHAHLALLERKILKNSLSNALSSLDQEKVCDAMESILRDAYERLQSAPYNEIHAEYGSGSPLITLATQYLLTRNHGINIDIDGMLGKKTKAAIRKIEEEYGLPRDSGLIGSDVIGVLLDTIEKKSKKKPEIDDTKKENEQRKIKEKDIRERERACINSASIREIGVDHLNYLLDNIESQDGCIDLSGLESLSCEVAEVLSRAEVDSISLNGIHFFNSGVFDVLMKCDRVDISLEGLVALPEYDVAVLDSFSGVIYVSHELYKSLPVEVRDQGVFRTR